MSINTEIGGATANSYVSVASADSYMEARINADKWTDISLNTNGTSATSEKENLLKEATREIDFNLRFHDYKYYDVLIGDTNYQSLDFPRSSNIDSSGDRMIPDEVKYATYEQALWLKERSGKRTDSVGSVINPQTLGGKVIQYINPWINRQVVPTGQYPWQGSDF